MCVLGVCSLSIPAVHMCTCSLVCSVTPPCRRILTRQLPEGVPACFSPHPSGNLARRHLQVGSGP